jgi:hypothetical protein
VPACGGRPYAGDVGDIDASTWQAIGITLTLVGLVISFVVWKRRGAAAGLRGVAWSLLPAAAGLTGTLRLLWQIADLVVSWAARLVFSPVVWLGITLAGVSVVLFGVSAAMRSRGVGSASKAGRQSEVSGERSTAKAESLAQVPTQARGSKPKTKSAGQRKGGDVGDANDMGDMDDIEAILRRHGIS